MVVGLLREARKFETSAEGSWDSCCWPVGLEEERRNQLTIFGVVQVM